MSTDTGPVYDHAAADFNAVYVGGELLEGAEIRSVPWDIGAPQPVVINWERAGRIRGEVLDAGCGLGDNAIHLARHGHHVTAIDAASEAINQARQRAAGLGIEFVVADATDLSAYEGRFATIVDSALYHTLSEENRRRYVATLYRVARPDALLNMMAFATVPGGMPAGLSVTEETVRADLTRAGWTITDLRRDVFSGVAAAVEKFAADTGLVLELDEFGRSRLPVWTIEAYRT